MIELCSRVAAHLFGAPDRVKAQAKAVRDWNNLERGARTYLRRNFD